MGYNLSGFKAHYEQGSRYMYVINGVESYKKESQQIVNKKVKRALRFDLIQQKWSTFPDLIKLDSVCPGSFIIDSTLYVIGEGGKFEDPMIEKLDLKNPEKWEKVPIDIGLLNFQHGI